MCFLSGEEIGPHEYDTPPHDEKCGSRAVEERSFLGRCLRRMSWSLGDLREVVEETYDASKHVGFRKFREDRETWKR